MFMEREVEGKVWHTMIIKEREILKGKKDFDASAEKERRN